MAKPDPKVTAIARPMRIAYILEDGDDAQAWIDEIIADCFARHGGRQSLIVPILNGSVSERYRAWLKTIDPDVVILLTYNNDELASDLGSLLENTLLMQRQRKHGEIENHPRISLEKPALTALSWIPFFKTVSGIRRKPIEFILDRYPAWKDDGLIKDNFGTLCDSMNQFPIHEQINVRPLMLTPENAPENRWHIRIANAEEVSDAYSVLESLVRSGTPTLGHFSNLSCQPFRHDHPWLNAFCLVVGDSFEDRIACWNAGLLFDDATTQPIKTLRVPSTAIAETEKIEKIATFLRAANWLGGNSGPPKITVRSHSLSAAVLEEFVNRIGPIARSIVTFMAIETLDDCCPVKVTDIYPAHRGLLPLSVINETSVKDGSTFIEVPILPHLKYNIGQHPLLSQGAWSVDLTIDKLDDHGRYSNIRQAWMLPKRRQLIQHFIKIDHARILSNGHLSVTVDIETPAIEVTQPNDEIFFGSLLTETSSHAYKDIRFKQNMQPPFKYFEPSDKGRYLAGLLGMFESLSDVENIMNTRFWRRQFYAMAAPAIGQHQEVITFLKRRLNANAGTLVINDAEGWDRLANRVVQKASYLKVPRLRTQYDKLLEQWLKELNEAIDIDEHLKSRKESILAEAPSELKSSLGFLVDRRVFYRGHEWVCRKCSHRNWADIQALAEVIPCEICAMGHNLPIDISMDFRLNEFFATCLREHDTLTVACILTALRRQSHSFFSFYPQTAIYRKYPEDQNWKPSRELDILCISDGKFIIGEAKARAELIGPSDIEDLAETAKDLCVDIAILATLSDERSLIPAKLEKLKTLLPATIEARSIIANWEDEPSTYLSGKVDTYRW